MNDTKKKEQTAVAEIEQAQWGETKQERIVDDSPRHGSDRHHCKGRGCKSAFEKL